MRERLATIVLDGFWKNKRIVLFDTLLSPEMNEQLKKLNSPEPTTDKKTDEVIDGDEKSEKPEEVWFKFFIYLNFLFRRAMRSQSLLECPTTR